MSTKAIFITWEPKAALDGMMQLDPWEELAYRRILDLIYVSGNKLVDDDKKLAWMTKTGNRWKRIRKTLFGGDEPKLYSADGYVRNKKCDEKLEKIDAKIEEKSKAGKASAKKRKQLKDKETGATGVGGVLDENPPQTSTDGQLNHLTTEPPLSETNVSAQSGPPKEPKDRVWGPFLSWLVDHTAKPEASLRPIVGKWCRDYGEERLCEVLAIAECDNPAEPISWITAKLSGKGKRGWMLTSSIDNISERIEAAEDRDAALGWENAYQYLEKWAVEKFRKYGGVRAA